MKMNKEQQNERTYLVHLSLMKNQFLINGDISKKASYGVRFNTKRGYFLAFDVGATISTIVTA